jgi:hypothetical protein
MSVEKVPISYSMSSAPLCHVKTNRETVKLWYTPKCFQQFWLNFNYSLNGSNCSQHSVCKSSWYKRRSRMREEWDERIEIWGLHREEDSSRRMHGPRRRLYPTTSLHGVTNWRWRQHGPPKRWYRTTSLQGVTPWRWRQQGPPKRWYPNASLQGVTTQKTSNLHHRVDLKSRN